MGKECSVLKGGVEENCPMFVDVVDAIEPNLGGIQGSCTH